MSLSSMFHDHYLIFGSSLILAGFVAGFSVNQALVESYKNETSVQKEILSSDVAELKDEIKAKEAEIYTLNTQLYSVRNELANRHKRLASDGSSIQTLNAKYSNLSTDYQKLLGWYNNLQSQYKLAQSNCSVLGKVNQLELENKNLVAQLKSVSVLDRNVEQTKEDIRWQMHQNHERLIGLQSKLVCS